MQLVQTQMINIDLSDDLTVKDTALVDREMGARLRTKYGLAARDKDKESVTIFVPHHIRAISFNFFDGMFGPSLNLLGVERFEQRYKFDCESGNLVGSLPRDVWDWHHPAKVTYDVDEDF